MSLPNPPLPAAAQLARCRWSAESSDQDARKAAAQALANRRWGKSTAEERAAFGLKLRQARAKHRRAPTAAQVSGLLTSRRGKPSAAPSGE